MWNVDLGFLSFRFYCDCVDFHLTCLDVIALHSSVYVGFNVRAISVKNSFRITKFHSPLGNEVCISSAICLPDSSPFFTSDRLFLILRGLKMSNRGMPCSYLMIA